MSHEQWSGFNPGEKSPTPEEEWVSPFAVLAERYGFTKDRLDAALAGNEFVAAHLEEGERSCAMLVRLMGGENAELAAEARKNYNAAIAEAVGANLRPRAQMAEVAEAIARVEFMWAIGDDEGCYEELEAVVMICQNDQSQDWSEDLRLIEELRDKIGI